MRLLLILLAIALPSAIGWAEEEPVQPDRIVEYKAVGDTKLTLHVFNPSGHEVSDRRPAIVFFFGGGWNGGSPEQFCPQSEYLSTRGMVAICAEYRVRKKHKTTPPECVQDGKSALRWVRAHSDSLGIDPNKLAAVGGSAGGHVAAVVALTDGFNEEDEDLSVSCRPDALVLFNPVFDNGPTGYGYNRVKEYWEAFSPMHNLDETAPPTIVFLGTRDPLIPTATAEEYQSRMNVVGARCELRLYKGQPHGFFNPWKKNNKYRETLIETDKFLSSLGYLKGEPTLKAP